MDEEKVGFTPENITLGVADKTAVIESVEKFKTSEEYLNSLPSEENGFSTAYSDDEMRNRELKQKKISEREKNRRAYRKRQLRKQQSRRTFAHIFGSVLLIIFIISISSYLAYYIVRAALDVTGIVTNEYEVEVEIPESATTVEISKILKENNIIDLDNLFVFFSKLTDSDGDYKNGVFTLSSSMSYKNIINALQTEAYASEFVTVRIREAMTADEIGKLLEENFVCRAEDFEYFYRNKQNVYNFEKRVLQNSKKFYQLEGYLFPDTYEFYVVDQLKEGISGVDTSSYAELAVEKIYSNYNSKITKEIYKQINEMGFTLDEFMTLASMVQAEAGTITDMELVASVFLNRLKYAAEYPYLQSDVTKIYADEVILPKINGSNESLYKPIYNSYSTYENEGLPPGPICNPGMSAIEAVLNAPETDYFYFCANEETLEIFYAENLAQHEQNLIKAGLA